MKLTNIGASHQLIKDIKKQNIKKQQMFVIDDLSVLQSKYCQQLDCEAVIVCEELAYSDSAKQCIEQYVNKSKQSYSVSKKVFESIAQKENSAGLLAIIKKQQTKLENLKNCEFVLINDGIEIAGNLGTIFRTCDATGVDMVINTNTVANAYSEKVLHSSRGMVLKVPFVNAETNQVIKQLKQNNFNIILCETLNGTNYFDANYCGKIAIVIGSERFGIDKLWLQEKTQNVFIPMYGEMKSLNVGVAGSIALYQAKMKRNGANNK